MVNVNSTTQSAHIFARYAGEDADRWNLVMGRRIYHVDLGWATITKVEDRNTDPPLITMKFEHDLSERRFGPDVIGDVSRFSDLDLLGLDLRQDPAEVAIRAEADRRREELKAKERMQEAELQKLRSMEDARKQSAALVREQLREIDDSRRRREEERQRKADEERKQQELERQRNLEEILQRAIENERQFDETGDGWLLVKASSDWRRLGWPKEALRVTDKASNYFIGNAHLRAALLTTRGGAFRDCGRLMEALRAAQQAIECVHGSYQAYRLLGAVHYQLGDPDSGESAFNMASDLRGDSFEPDEEVIRSWWLADPMARKKIETFLQSRDPERYARIMRATHYHQNVDQPSSAPSIATPYVSSSLQSRDSERYLRLMHDLSSDMH